MNELAQLLKRASSEALRSVNTCMPGRIISYDSGSGMASVQPLLSRRQPGGLEEDMPVINGVPVIFPRAGGGSLTFPVSKGDGVLLVFSQRSIEEYKESRDKVIPVDPRAFDLSDAVAIIGLAPGSGGASDAVEMSYKGSTVRIDGGGVTIIGNLVVEGNVTLEGDLLVEGDIDYTGEVDDLEE